MSEAATPASTARPRADAPILVSACLAGVPCRYDARAKPDPALVDAARQGRAVPVCAECLGGLPTPRPPAELVGGDGHAVLDGDARVLTANGADVTGAFVAGARAVVDVARRTGASVAVLQARSPSCGRGQVHDGSYAGRLVEGDGVTAAALLDAGVQVVVHGD